MTTISDQISFGPFRLDTASSRLTRDGEEVGIRRQALQALRILVENPGHFIDYDQMIQQAWEGVVVSRHTVAVTVGEAKRALHEYANWISYRPRFGYRLEVPRSEDVIKKGWHFWYRHTKEGFEKAISCFQQAANADATDFRAFEGLGASYLMLGTHGMRHPIEMYRNFRDAHDRAVMLGGMTPELRADHAQGLHLFEGRIAEAEAEALQAQHGKPGLAAIHIRLAMIYASSGRHDQALQALREIRTADALCPLLASTEIVVHFCRRDFEAAMECGKRAIELHPYMQLARLYYGKALEYAGDTRGALDQYRMAYMISPDLPWVRAMEGRCLALRGNRREAMAFVRELEETRHSAYVDPYHFALLLDAVGKRDRAFEELYCGLRENSPLLFLLDIDPKLDGLRADPRFARFRDQVFGNVKTRRQTA